MRRECESRCYDIVVVRPGWTVIKTSRNSSLTDFLLCGVHTSGHVLNYRYNFLILLILDVFTILYRI